MMLSPANLALELVASAFAFMAAVALLAPQRVTAQFDIPDLTRAGRNEVRAVYGGFGVAMAAALIVALNDSQIRSGICIAIGFALLGMAFGRLVSLIMDRGIGRMPLFYGCLEIVGGLLLLYAS